MKRAYRAIAAEFGPLPRPDLECATCRQTLAFGTDWLGRTVQVCGCQRSFVPIKRGADVPAVPRQPTGKRVFKYGAPDS